MKIINISVITLGILLMSTSCRKFVHLEGPPTSSTADQVFSSNEQAAAVVSYVYYQMANTEFYSQGYGGISFLAAVSADELRSYTVQSLADVNANAILPTNMYAINNWTIAYKNIYHANLVMENLAQSPVISDAVKRQLTGECRFIRAFFHFYTSGLFGKVPLVTSTDYNVNTRLPRSSVAEVYNSIVADLKEAQLLLTDQYVNATNTTTTERIRPNKAVATALLAKVYLYMKDWANAEAQASTVIGNSTYVLEPDLLNVFRDISREAIWQLKPVLPFGQDGRAMIITQDPRTIGSSAYSGTPMTNVLYNAFDPSDKRRANWVGTFTAGQDVFRFAHKYKNNAGTPAIPEYLMAFRLAEQYLIRAEARAMQGKLTGAGSAAEDINAIRNRAFDDPALKVTHATTLPQMMLAIEQERRTELFTEWGNRMMDLRRWAGFNNPNGNRADEVMPLVMLEKGVGTWAAYKTLFPVPQQEILNNPSLAGDQNPGYGF